jgi:hypothetical protein
MEKKDFENYLQATAKKKVDSKEFIEKELSQWRYFLDLLYKNIIAWLDDYIKKGFITYKTSQKTIHEEFSGYYTINSLILTVNNIEIIFDPIGTMLIGSKGRVDIKSKNGTIMLTLVDKSLNGPNIQVKIYTSEKERKDDEEKIKSKPKNTIEWAWKIFHNSNDHIEYVELTENTFLDIIMELTNG